MTEIKPATKQDIIEMLQRMPDDASMEDMFYAVYVRASIELGLEDVRQGRTITHEEMLKNVAEWLQSTGQ